MLDDVVVIAAAGGNPEGAEIDDVELRLANAPLSVIASRVCRLRNSLSFSNALRTRAIFRTTGSYDEISASLSKTKARLNMRAFLWNFLCSRLIG